MVLFMVFPFVLAIYVSLGFAIGFVLDVLFDVPVGFLNVFLIVLLRVFHSGLLQMRVLGLP